jgi:hypothetical protein
VKSAVFTATDYRELVEDTGQFEIMRLLFAQATVVFIGYSLRDKYVLELFQNHCCTRRLFGDGPHFMVRSGDSPTLPESIKPIRYLSEPHSDHRSALNVLDIIRLVQVGGHASVTPDDRLLRAKPEFTSAYFISDVTPPGTWTSSQTLEIGNFGVRANVVVGQGFENSELPQETSPAMHDLTVGLVSFDYLYFPLSCAAKLHNLLGSQLFWDLIKADIFRFIYFEYEPAMVFKSLTDMDGGDIGSIRISTKEGNPLTLDEQIRKQFQGSPGRETDAERLFEKLKTRVSKFDHEKFDIPSLTRGALLHPAVRQLLGISDAVLPTSLPRWNRFSVIRLAHAITAGCACDNFALPAVKFGFGSEILIGAAFAVSAARDWADSVSSYVVAGQFDTNLGAYVESNPSVLTAILNFRDTHAGITLRREILDELSTNAGSEFVASVNAGLRALVPTTVMETARTQLSQLLFRKDRESMVVPAVWTNVRNSDSIARLWRAKSRGELEKHCKLIGLGPYDLCPCGSGAKLRFCCAHALCG